ncbi:uncharacterized protein LOC119725708 [Patiria miniata]|uniref:F-box domain-containing protein n=1 Tax=Patiria miniata TaxID=46514 RepID=A0A913ZP68_PATMI|nr:uncharacterized protein LOC119725708 [Patiria miniata]
MESARKPQLSDLRQKRLAYFDQKYAPSPPTEPKPSSNVNLASTQISNGSTQRGGKKTSGYYGDATYNKTGAIPKSYKKGQRGVDSTTSNSVENSGGYSYQVVAAKKKSTNQQLSAQDFEIHTPNDVDELFQSNRGRPRKASQVPEEKTEKVHPSEPIRGNVLDAASVDYERRLMEHLQRPDRQNVNTHIRTAQIRSGDSRGDDMPQRNNHLVPRKKHLKKFLFRQDEDTSPALKAAAEHDALYAQNILNQMGHVRKLRAQVHGELMSGFSEQEFGLNPVSSKAESLEQDLSREDPVSSIQVGSSQMDGGLQNRSIKDLQEPTSVSVYSLQADSHRVTKTLSPPPSNSTVYLQEEDSGTGGTSDQDKGSGSENLDNDMTFDLGALQDAAKQGDDILRKYIQSLSKNIKKKKLNESIGETTGNAFKPDPHEIDGPKPDEVQDLDRELSSHPRHPKKFLNTDLRPEQETSIPQTSESNTVPRTRNLERQHRPKVSQPSVTSTELQSLGLFQDLQDMKHNSQDPGHDTTKLHTQLKSGPNQPRRLDGMVEDSTEDEDFGLSTHRPMERPLSPLKQVYVNRKERHLEGSEDDSTDPVKRHQNNTENNQSDLSDAGLSLQKDDAVPEKDHTSQTGNVFHTFLEPEVDNTLFRHHSLENFTSSTDQSGDERLRKQPPSYEKLFSNPTGLSSDSIPFPHPSGTEIGNFVCPEQSTDSDQDAHKNLARTSQLIPIPPQQEKTGSTSFKRHKPAAQKSARNKSPRRPKTPERHVEGVREHHERERETRRQLSARKSQKKSLEQETGNLAKSSTDEDPALRHPHPPEDRFNSEDVLKVENLFESSSWKESWQQLNLGPSGDAKNHNEQNQTGKMCPRCTNFSVNSQSECEACGTVIHNESVNPVDSVIPSFDSHFKDVSSGGAATARTHLTTGSAWDIEISAPTQENKFPRITADDESTVMGKIANFVPKLTDGGGDVGGSKKSRGPVSSNETGAGDASHVFGDLPNRVDAWLAANETSRRSDASANLDPTGQSANHKIRIPDQLRQSSDEEEAEHKVTFELSPQVDLGNQHLHQNGHAPGLDDRLGKKIKPRPSSAGPQQSRQEATRPKGSVSKSRTGQLIDQPMYNRRWATSSSTWGTRRSVGGQRSTLIDSIPASNSPTMQRKRPSSAKHDVPLHKSEAEPRVRGQRPRPQSANWKSRESKDLGNSKKRSGNLKDEFLTVNTAQIEEGLASRALHASHSMLPLTLQLICDSPRGGDDVSIWELLPDEILLHVFRYLSYKDLIKCAASCSRFHRIAMDDSLWRTIKLHKRQVSDFSLTQIGERHPTSLSLTQCYGNIVTENGLRNLFRCCADTLQELNVSGCTGGDLTGDSLLLHASRCNHLTSLDASWSQATDNGLSAISDSCQRLTSLCLNGCQSVSDECLNRVIKKHGRSLRVLEVLGCVQLSPETLQLIGQECRNLHTLNIGQCYKVTDECISQLVSHLRNLKHLDMRGCKQIRDSCVRKIVRNCKRLQTLVLANCTHITNAAMVEIATYLPTIRSLDVSGCKKVNNEGVRSLATCCHYLTSLDVSSTGVDNKSVSALANYCNKTLVSVRFNCCKDITETAIVKLLKNCKKLETLHLYGVKGLRNLGVLKLQYPCLWFE